MNKKPEIKRGGLYDITTAYPNGKRPKDFPHLLKTGSIPYKYCSIDGFSETLRFARKFLEKFSEKEIKNLMIEVEHIIKTKLKVDHNPDEFYRDIRYARILEDRVKQNSDFTHGMEIYLSALAMLQFSQFMEYDSPDEYYDNNKLLEVGRFNLMISAQNAIQQAYLLYLTDSERELWDLEISKQRKKSAEIRHSPINMLIKKTFNSHKDKIIKATKRGELLNISIELFWQNFSDQERSLFPAYKKYRDYVFKSENTRRKGNKEDPISVVEDMSSQMVMKYLEYNKKNRAFKPIITLKNGLKAYQDKENNHLNANV